MSQDPASKPYHLQNGTSITQKRIRARENGNSKWFIHLSFLMLTASEHSSRNDDTIHDFASHLHRSTQKHSSFAKIIFQTTVHSHITSRLRNPKLYQMINFQTCHSQLHGVFFMCGFYLPIRPAAHFGTCQSRALRRSGSHLRRSKGADGADGGVVEDQRVGQLHASWRRGAIDSRENQHVLQL